MGEGAGRGVLLGGDDAAQCSHGSFVTNGSKVSANKAMSSRCQCINICFVQAVPDGLQFCPAYMPPDDAILYDCFLISAVIAILMDRLKLSILTHTAEMVCAADRRLLILGEGSGVHPSGSKQTSQGTAHNKHSSKSVREWNTQTVPTAC